MRTTIVPAQITTVEDKIAGRLGLSQLALLTIPVFGGGAIFVILPPFFSYATCKIVIITCLASLSGILAIRIKGKILLFWALIILRYNLRPRFYVFNKNDVHLRQSKQRIKVDETVDDAAPKKEVRSILPQLTTAELVQVENLIQSPEANLHFTTNRKGELSVHFTEVQ